MTFEQRILRDAQRSIWREYLLRLFALPSEFELAPRCYFATHVPAVRVTAFRLPMSMSNDDMQAAMSGLFDGPEKRGRS